MTRAFAVARSALALERTRAKRQRSSPTELAFLPAAVEIVETPPSPTARIMTWGLIAFFVIAIVWASLGKTDVVAVAEGRLVASGRSKVIQPMEIGVVRAIHVKDGSFVRQGEVLVELDLTSIAAERERLSQDFLSAQITAMRLHALLSDIDPDVAVLEFRGLPGISDAFIATQRNLLVSEAEELRARQRQLADELSRRKAEAAATQSAIYRYDEAIPLLKERTNARGELAEMGFGSRLLYLEVKQQLVELEQERNVQRHRLEQANASVAALESQRLQIEAEFRRSKTADLNDAERRAIAIAQELVKAEQRHVLQTLTAPIDGVVQQLAIHTIGGVVTPAQHLMVIVPAEDGIELEAMLHNRDVGFVRVGQSVEVKVETFNYTRYGLLPAEVTSISGDAIIDEKRGPVYAARVKLLRSTINVDGQEIRLAPGMSATAEIKTDERHIIEFFLSPLLRYRQESMRER